MAEGRFCAFLGFLRGVLEKVGGGTWFLAGEIVVECVVNVVVWTPVFGAKKYATVFNFIFCRSF